MQPIRIIDSSFTLLAEIDDYESLQFIRRWYKVGEFELHININKNNTDKLKEDNLIILGTDYKKVGVIRHREIKIDENGKQSEELVVKGYTLKGIVSRRITVPPAGEGYDKIKDNAETVMKHYVDINCINPADIKRKIPQLIIATDLKRGIYTQWQSRYKQLDTELEDIANYADLGWDIYIDIENCKWVFDVYEGRNLTAFQDILPPVIFSIDFDNIKAQSFLDSAISHKNVGYVGGQGEEEERTIIQVGEYEGLERIETFIDANDIEDETELPERGQQKLNEMQQIRSFESEILTNGPFIYGVDWDLGDIVTVQNKKWGLTLDSRITEVKEIYEASGFKIEVTFGNTVPTLIDKLKKELNKPMVEKSTITITDIPTKTSQLENDAGFVTAAEVAEQNTYIHEQIFSSSEWYITHNLNKYPSVTIVDSAGTVVIGDIEYVSTSVVKVIFKSAFSGKAYLN